MKRRIVALLLCLVLAFAAAGCQPKEEAPADPQTETVTITDFADQQVTVPKNAQRIVVCDILPLPSVLTVFFNSGERIVGMSPTSMSAAQNGLLGQLYPEVLQAETGFINGTEVNMEELLKLKPDIVFYSIQSMQLGKTSDRPASTLWPFPPISGNTTASKPSISGSPF